jgi:hypothetical protein
MAQHISILNSNLKKHQSIVKVIKNQFAKGLNMIKYAIRYDRLDDDYRFDDYDIVYKYQKLIDSEIEIFEIHFDKINNKIIDIFLVK